MDATPPPVFDQLTVLGDATRCRILSLLELGELSVTEVCQALQLPQSTVSRHLRVLLEGGWVLSRPEGPSRLYRLTDLPAGPSTLWEVVHGQMKRAGFLDEDGERARGVLARRVERSRSFFSQAAGRWDELREELYGRDALVLPLLGLLDPTASVGDLGCGTGTLSARVAPFVGRVFAVDRSPEMLETAGRRLASEKNVELLEGELEALPMGDGALDLALLSLVLHYVVDPSRVLAEAHRVLRPGGRLIVVDLRAHRRDDFKEEMGHVWPGFTPDQMHGWLEDAGFERAFVRAVPPDAEGRGPLLFVAYGERGVGGGAVRATGRTIRS